VNSLSAQLDDVVTQKLTEPHIWHFATVGPQNLPHVTAMWAHERDGRILCNSALGRVKPRNIEHNPHVAMSWYDPENVHHSLAIQGVVVETILGDQAEADIDFLAQKYLGQPRYPWRAEGERRVTYLIEPVRVYRQQG
jgi:PPOX class probable F420-dependent enzyme